jgi:2-C-methyl-D-erythritol 4-phosphate cytidylyltransferase
MFVVTVPKNHIAQAQDLIRPFVSLTGIEIVEGGAKRQDSVWKGLCAMEAHDIEYVLIHDAARPWVSQELICTVFAATEKYGACIPVVEISDAVVELDEEGFVSRHLSKASSKGVQTPEGFHFNEIFAAHREARDSSRLFHDDAEILMHTGKKVFTIPGRTENKKITYSHDLESL